MDYISEIILTINQVHHCVALHRATVPGTEVFKGPMVWDGDVEIFTLVNHPKAQKAYAWGYPRESDYPREITIILELPVAGSPQIAAQAAGGARLASPSNVRPQAPNSLA